MVGGPTLAQPANIMPTNAIPIAALKVMLPKEDAASRSR
jgi:hypothetical protein